VVGATKADYFEKVRNVAPDHFLLIPGVGAQGGALEDLRSLLTSDVGILVNSSRGIIYASSAEDYATAAAREAQKLQVAMSEMLR